MASMIQYNNILCKAFFLNDSSCMPLLNFSHRDAIIMVHCQAHATHHSTLKLYFDLQVLLFSVEQFSKNIVLN